MCLHGLTLASSLNSMAMSTGLNHYTVAQAIFAFLNLWVI